MTQEEIITFLINAKQNTYASDLGKVKSTRPNSYDLEYSEGPLTYRDTYLGTHAFSGQEAVWEDPNPIWAMNYSGRVLDNDLFSSAFLKQALMYPTPDYPFRGQPTYQHNGYTYSMQFEGDFTWFTGKEIITFEDRIVYELYFHGGKVVDKHFD